jgi:hypothetical protein
MTTHGLFSPAYEFTKLNYENQDTTQDDRHAGIKAKPMKMITIFRVLQS